MEAHREKYREKKNSNLNGLWDNIQPLNIHVIGVRKGEKCGQKAIFEKFSQIFHI